MKARGLMKALRRYHVGIAVLIAALILSSCRTDNPPLLPEGALPLGDIVSSCTGDVSSDGENVFLAISGVSFTEDEERYGELLLVCDESAGFDLAALGYIQAESIIYSIDLSDIKPMKLQLGDINGDGLNEISLCVYKTAKFHDVMAKRPFFFDLIDGNLIPIWLGSRLSRPFDDYILSDLNGDGYDEIVSIEQLENGSRIIAVYNWKGFGFEVMAESEAFDCGLRFVSGNSTSFFVERSDNNEQLEYLLTEGGLQRA